VAVPQPVAEPKFLLLLHKVNQKLQRPQIPDLANRLRYGQRILCCEAISVGPSRRAVLTQNEESRTNRPAFFIAGKSFKKEILCLLRGLFRFSLIFALDRFVDFLTMYGDLGWSFNSEANFVTTNVNNGDLDVVADENTFIALS